MYVYSACRHFTWQNNWPHNSTQPTAGRCRANINKLHIIFIILYSAKIHQKLVINFSNPNTNQEFGNRAFDWVRLPMFFFSEYDLARLVSIEFDCLCRGSKKGASFYSLIEARRNTLSFYSLKELQASAIGYFYDLRLSLKQLLE